MTYKEKNASTINITKNNKILASSLYERDCGEADTPPSGCGLDGETRRSYNKSHITLGQYRYARRSHWGTGHNIP